MSIFHGSFTMQLYFQPPEATFLSPMKGARDPKAFAAAQDRSPAGGRAEVWGRTEQRVDVQLGFSAV